MRWTKAGRTRTYHLKEFDGPSELWVTSHDGRREKSRKLATFIKHDDVEPFLDAVAQDLRAGGWLDCDVLAGQQPSARC
jgi:hypothetical protein